MVSIFERPIPGQSLTAEPGRSPWERPPEFPNPVDALEYHLKELAQKEVVDDLIDALDIGIPVSVVAGSIVNKGLMEGMHTVDTTMLLKPMIMMHIKGLAEVAGIDYKMSMEDYADVEEQEREAFARKLAMRLNAQIKDKEPDAGVELMGETQEYLEQGMPEGEPEQPEPEMAEPEQQQEQQEEMPMEEPKAERNGLMARG